MASPTHAIQTPAGWTCESTDRFVLHSAPALDQRMAFAHSIASGLTGHPRRFEARFLYDHVGSEVYERITEQPEYYLTRAEDAILAAHAPEIRRRVGDVTLIELGSGSSTKTRHLLNTGFSRYVPIDISASALRSACTALGAAYPALHIEALATTYDEGLAHVHSVQPAMLSFLGSSIGNLNAAQTDSFLERVTESLLPGGSFLLGVDLVKDAARLEAAYDDAAGWTSRFTRNLFDRANRELGADIPYDAVEHVSYYNARMERIEIYARFRREVVIEVLGQSHRIARGEMIPTEISRKYRAREVAANAARFGLVMDEVFSDGDFAVLLFRRTGQVPVRRARDAHGMRLLRRERRQTLDLVDALDDVALAGQHSPLMSPIAWDLAHIAEFERLWMVRTLHGEPAPVIPDAVNPDLQQRAVRGAIPLPDRVGLLDLLAEVRREATAAVAAASGHDLLTQGYLYRMVAQHEAQHQETMLQAAQLLPETTSPFDPGFSEPSPPRPEMFPEGMVSIPGGPFTLGTDDTSAAYDNERPAHTVDLAAFEIDVAPVTNGQFAAFIAASGYEERAHWSEAGWAWKVAESATAPLFWSRDPDAAWTRTLFGRAVGLDPHRPVVHVSWFEADAYARWAGKRLPTEAEWEFAAAWDSANHVARAYPWGNDPPGPDHANLNQDRLMTTPIGSWPAGRSFFGCHQMLGDVWEWTSSWFAPYPGFQAHPYPEYSEPFFGERYRVLRGGSFATRECVARNTVRNWDFPQRRQIFAGFRCAR